MAQSRVGNIKKLWKTSPIGLQIHCLHCGRIEKVTKHHRYTRFSRKNGWHGVAGYRFTCKMCGSEIEVVVLETTYPIGWKCALEAEGICPLKNKKANFFKKIWQKLFTKNQKQS